MLPGLGISIPDVFVLKDIRVEVFFECSLSDDILISLLRRGHPKENPWMGKQESVDIKKDEVEEKAKKVVYSAVRAEKGIYVLEVKNKGKDTYKGKIICLLYEKTSSQRVKEFKDLTLYPEDTLQIRFLLPESVFWDDEDYFSGSIEDSNSITKFNHKTGIVWKEKR